jgi:hypothetical protein
VRVNLVLLLVVLAMFGGSPVSGQSPNASISGVVLDPDKRSIPNAEILVVNDYTRVQYEAKTNAEGFFAVTNLPPGQYRIQVSKVGFKAIIKPDIILNVQDALAITFTLPIGASSVVVTVEGGAPMIDTTDATVSTVVDRQFAENLPMNGRSFQTLIYLTPGVVATTSSLFDSGQFSVNGQRASSNYWMVDGVSANIGSSALTNPGNGLGGTLGSFSAMGGTNSLVSVDALQEFRIQTSTFAPEFGRTPGGQISIVTRSGSDEWHGSAFDYFRNDALDAANWFNGYRNNPPLAKSEERQNDFGGTLGGPIGTHKTFFFFSYEGLRLRLPETVLTNVPDLGARSSATAAMEPYLNAFPIPNGTDNPQRGVAQFNATISNPGSLDAYALRVDQTLGNKLSLFGRFNYAPSQLQERGGTTGRGALSMVQPISIRTETGTVGLVWTIRPSLANDLRFNYSDTDAQSFYALDNFGGAIPLAALPFPEGFTKENGQFSLLIFSLGIGEVLDEGPFGHNRQRQVNVVDNVTKQMGSHLWKFGVDFRRLSPTFDPGVYQQTVGFLNVGIAASGRSTFGSLAATRNLDVRFLNLGLYAQDTWRVNSRFELTYGLRWDLDASPVIVNGPGIPAVTGYSLTDLANLAIAPSGTPAFSTPYGNFAPRVGGAYQIRQSRNWESVVRGGFGVFYDLVSAETGNLLANRYPPIGNQNLRLGGSPFPFSPSQIAPLSIPDTATLAQFEVFNPDLKLPYTLEWNVSAQQALGTQQSVTLSYVGSSGRRLLQTTSFIDPSTDPSIGSANFIDNTASSNYNALQIQFQRRLSRGLQSLASYTFSHSIDNASASSFGEGSNLGLPGTPNANRGNSDFDIRHQFSAGLTYDVPAPRGRAVARVVFGGWSLESLVLARSAPPVDLTDAAFSGFESGVNTNIRPDIVRGQPFYLYGPVYPGGKALNPAALANPPSDPTTGVPLRQGTLPRNFLRGFGATEWDFAMHREFALGDRLRLQFRAEMFNVLNHPNFGAPNTEFGATGFGISTSMLSQSLSNGSLGGGGFQSLYQIGGPRSIQLALKLTL